MGPTKRSTPSARITLANDDRIVVSLALLHLLAIYKAVQIGLATNGGLEAPIKQFFAQKILRLNLDLLKCAASRLLVRLCMSRSRNYSARKAVPRQIVSWLFDLIFSFNPWRNQPPIEDAFIRHISVIYVMDSQGQFTSSLSLNLSLPKNWNTRVEGFSSQTIPRQWTGIHGARRGNLLVCLLLRPNRDEHFPSESASHRPS